VTSVTPAHVDGAQCILWWWCWLLMLPTTGGWHQCHGTAEWNQVSLQWETERQLLSAAHRVLPRALKTRRGVGRARQVLRDCSAASWREVNA